MWYVSQFFRNISSIFKVNSIGIKLMIQQFLPQNTTSKLLQNIISKIFPKYFKINIVKENYNYGILIYPNAILKLFDINLFDYKSGYL